MYSWLFAAALALPAPALAEAPPPAEAAQIMALPEELRVRLQERVIDGSPSRAQRFERLVEFMFEPAGLGMSYQDEPTPTVAEAYATRKANCLGFTLLFLALAEAADLDAWPQEIRETLSWRQQDGTIYRGTMGGSSRGSSISEAGL